MTSSYKTYAQFNQFTVNGRIYSSEIVSRPKGNFLSVSVITAPANDSEGMIVTFTNSNGLMALAQKGGLPVGRMVTLTGHIDSVHETYTNEAGEVVMLKRPRIHIRDAAIMAGGLGANPRKEESATRPAAGTVVVKRVSADATPVIETKQEITPDMLKEKVEALF